MNPIHFQIAKMFVQSTTAIWLGLLRLLFLVPKYYLRAWSSCSVIVLIIHLVPHIGLLRSLNTHILEKQKLELLIRLTLSRENVTQ